MPGLFFAGTIGQAAKGLQRHGQPSNSGAVHGARYNARLLVRATRRDPLRRRRTRPQVAAADLVDLVTSELAEAPELWHQRGYLARVITADPDAGLVDDGVQPLSHVLDAGGPDALAFTLEADGTGAIYPVLYSRIRGAMSERMVDPGPVAALRRAGGPARHRGGRSVGRAGRRRSLGRPEAREPIRGGLERGELLGEREPQLRAAELRTREE